MYDFLCGSCVDHDPAAAMCQGQEAPADSFMKRHQLGVESIGPASSLQPDAYRAVEENGQVGCRALARGSVQVRDRLQV
jgi:hypothetical protein